jgi:hypothetical protein
MLKSKKIGIKNTGCSDVHVIERPELSYSSTCSSSDSSVDDSANVEELWWANKAYFFRAGLCCSKQHFQFHYIFLVLIDGDNAKIAQTNFK